MMKHVFYVPIKSVNLGHYFSKACICPVKYLNERNEDVQNIYDDYILLSSEKYTLDTNCSIELVLTDDEIKKYIQSLSDNFSLLKIFLPISRISGIYFKDKEQGEKTIWTIEQGKAFVPKRLVFFESNNINVDGNIIKSSETPTNSFDIKNASSLDTFNRLLGGFALMRLGGEHFMNYSLNYFITFSNINLQIKRELENVVQSLLLPIKNKFEWLIINNKISFEELYNLTYSKIDTNDLEQFASKNKIQIQKKLGKISLESIDNQSTTYLIAILVSYSDIGARLTLDNFISDLVQDQFPSSKKEGISLMFGINKGYDSFRNYYKTQNFEAQIKFALDNKIDYYTIESVYQYVVNNSISENFTYLEDLMPTTCINVNKKIYKTYRILNCEVIYDKKATSIKEVVNSFLKRFFFLDFTEPLITNFEKLIGFKLTKEQNESKSKEFENILIKPLDECLRKLSLEIDLYYEDKNSELINELSNLNKEKEKLSDTLKKINKDLFNEINKYRDGQLDNNEVIEFINRLIQTIPKKSSDPQLKKEKNESSNISNKNPIGELFAGEEVSIPFETYPSNIDKEHKRKLLFLKNITYLKEEATKLGIKSVSRFKNVPEDKEKLINLIMAKVND